jgi:hypothetical protein
MEESRLVMVDERGKEVDILNWVLCQRVKMMDQNLARAVQNWGIELIGLRIQSFPVTGIKTRYLFSKFALLPASGKF